MPQTMFGRESHLPTAFRRQPFIRGIRKRNEDIGRWAHCVIDVAEGPLHKPDPVPCVSYQVDDKYFD